MENNEWQIYFNSAHKSYSTKVTVWIISYMFYGYFLSKLFLDQSLFDKAPTILLKYANNKPAIRDYN